MKKGKDIKYRWGIKDEEKDWRSFREEVKKRWGKLKEEKEDIFKKDNIEEKEYYKLYSAFEDFGSLQEALEKNNIKVEMARSIFSIAMMSTPIERSALARRVNRPRVRNKAYMAKQNP